MKRVTLIRRSTPWQTSSILAMVFPSDNLVVGKALTATDADALFSEEGYLFKRHTANNDN